MEKSSVHNIFDGTLTGRRYLEFLTEISGIFVYSTPLLNVQDFIDKIVNACAELQREQILAATQREVMRCLQ